MALNPSSGASRHLLPEGEKEKIVAVPIPQGEKEKASGSTLSSPSPLEGEGVSRRLTDEGAASQKRNFSRILRWNMTDAELKLWNALRGRRFEGFKFRRQVPIGPYFADFACLSRKLIVQLDGSQHEGSVRDQRRYTWLAASGYRVMRFWNADVLQALDGTMLAILDALKQTPHPAPAAPPSPSRGEGTNELSFAPSRREGKELKESL